MRKIISNFFIFIFLLCFAISVNAGIKTGLTAIAIKKTVPHLVKNYGKNTTKHLETKIVDYIKKDPNSKDKIFSFIDDYAKKIHHI